MQNKSESTLRRLAVVLKYSNDAITVQDLKGNILAWNRGAEKLYGFSEDEALKMNVIQLVPIELKDTALEYLFKISDGESVESFETQRLTKFGILLDIWITVTCLRDDHGQIDSISTTERDITKLKNELREKEKAVKILRGFLPICSYCKEIRDSKGCWHQIESYIYSHSEAEFSHSICPKCMKQFYPEFCKDKDEMNK